MKTDDLIKPAYINDMETRRQVLKSSSPEKETPPGLRHIKRLELWQKWSPLVPHVERKD